MKLEELQNYTWHAVYCWPQRELATAHELGAMGMMTIVPADKLWRVKRRGVELKRVRHKPVFPRYIFTGFAERPNWELLRERIQTVQGYMSFGRGPQQLKLADVEWLFRLRETLRGAEEPKPFEQMLKPGDKVRVARGPLAGQILTVDDVDAKKIHTFREFLGAMRLVQIPLGNLASIV